MLDFDLGVGCCLVPNTVGGAGFVDTEDVGWKDFDLELVGAWFQARWMGLEQEGV